MSRDKGSLLSQSGDLPQSKSHGQLQIGYNGLQTIRQDLELVRQRVQRIEWPIFLILTTPVGRGSVSDTTDEE